MKKILFVCTGNSCRSQMAEGFARALSNGSFDISSAGTAPIGVLQATIETMQEVDIDISNQTSDLLTKEMIDGTDYVVTLCSSARDNCPVIPSGVKHFHWDIPNPDRPYISQEPRRREFARVRDEIKKCVLELLKEIQK
jgi:arsenate reductase